jgi:hypothetical protein
MHVIFSADLTRGCYRLLLHNQDRLFLVRSFKGAAAADLAMLIIPWDRVGLIRVLAEYTSCDVFGANSCGSFAQRLHVKLKNEVPAQPVGKSVA